MAGGITFGGNITHNAPSEDDSSERVEIPFSDQQFLERAANKKPPEALEYLRSIVGGFVDGAYSWPFDYTLCLHWIAGSSGFYGSRVKAHCDKQTKIITDLLKAAGQATYYVIARGILWKLVNDQNARLVVKRGVEEFDYTDQLMRRLPNLARGSSSFVGRSMSGAAFTAWMQSGGTLRGRAPRGASIAIGGFNFFAASWGSALHATLRHQGQIDVVQLLVSFLTGNPSYRMSDADYTALYRFASEIGDELIND